VTLFVDTSAFYAAVDKGDREHARALTLLATGEPLVTTDHVVVETWLLVQRRVGHSAADAFLDGVLQGGAEIEMIEPADFEAARRIAMAFTDQQFSIVDRTSFAAMERLGLNRALSFDGDFAIYRFGPRRDRAFEIVA
jgi:uncharacterized protein